MRRLASIALMFLLFTPVAALAQSYPTEWWNPEALAQWVFPGMSPDWLRLPNVIWYVLVPFFTAFVIIYAILQELHIFRNLPSNKILGVIAFLFAFLLLPSGVLTYIVNIFYAAGAFIGLMAFGVLFIMGVLFWAWGRGHVMYREARDEAAIRKKVKAEIRKLEDKVQRKKKECAEEKAKGNTQKARKCEDELEKTRELLQKYKDRYGELTTPA